MDYQVVIVAAGSGKRMGAGQNKLFLSLSGMPIIIRTLQVFDQDPWCKGIILVIKEEEQVWFKHHLKNLKRAKPLIFAQGGAERQESVYNGLKKATHDIVLIHDGARPLVEREDLHRVAVEACEKGAAVLAVPVKESIKKVDHLQIVETVERKSLWAMQTPQAFRLPLILKAHEWGAKKSTLATDDAELVEWLKEPVYIVEGNYRNLKVTTAEDLIVGERLLMWETERKNGQ